MSMVNCKLCDRYIDSDKDGDCFIVSPRDVNDIAIYCEPCREEMRRISDDFGAGPILRYGEDRYGKPRT